MRIATVLLLLPFAALAKDKVAIDAPKPIVGQLTAALKKHYVGAAVKKPLPDSPSGADVKAGASGVGAKAVLLVRREAGQFTVMVLDASDGGLLEQLRVKAVGNKLKLTKDFEAKLIAAVGRAEGPKAEAPRREPEATPEPKETKPEPKETRPEPKEAPPPERRHEPEAETPREETVVSEQVEPRRSGEELPFLRAAVGGRIFSRRLYWTDDIFHRLAKYDLPAAPMAGLDVDFWPLALMTQGPASYVGLNGSFDYALGLGSQASDMVKYSTTALRLRLGLIGRIPVGSLEIRPALGWTMQSFAIKATGGAKPPLPDVSYSNIRVGTDVAFKVFGPVSIFAGAFYEQPLSTGEMGKTYFPRLSVAGFDADAGLAVVVSKLEVRASIDYTRFWYSMNPKPGDAYVAGGALDDYKGFNITIGFML